MMYEKLSFATLESDPESLEIRSSLSTTIRREKVITWWKCTDIWNEIRHRIMKFVRSRRTWSTCLLHACHLILYCVKMEDESLIESTDVVLSNIDRESNCYSTEFKIGSSAVTHELFLSYQGHPAKRHLCLRGKMPSSRRDIFIVMLCMSLSCQSSRLRKSMCSRSNLDMMTIWSIDGRRSWNNSRFQLTISMMIWIWLSVSRWVLRLLILRSFDLCSSFFYDTLRFYDSLITNVRARSVCFSFDENLSADVILHSVFFLEGIKRITYSFSNLRFVLSNSSSMIVAFFTNIRSRETWPWCKALGVSCSHYLRSSQSK